jgi:hypothetical protein
MDSRLYPVGSGGPKSRYINGTLVFDRAVNYVGLLHEKRTRLTLAQANAGTTLLAAIPGYKYRLVDAEIVAVGGAAGAGTSIEIAATSGGSGRDLVTFAQAQMTRSAVLRAGATGAAVLADGASFTANDANTAITQTATGTFDTATHFDVLLKYTLEAA